MTINTHKGDAELKSLLKMGKMDVPHADFEDKVMRKIEMVHISQATIRKNLKASWIFLVASILLFPTGFIMLVERIDFSLLPVISGNVNEIMDVLLPAGILLFAVVILIQIDNLLRLTLRTRLS